MKLLMRSMLILHNQLMKQAIHVWIKETGIFCRSTDLLRVTGRNGTFYQLLDLPREVFEESLNDRAIASLVWWAEHEIDGVVDPASRDHPCQILQTVRMVCPGIVQKQLQWNTETGPFLRHPKGLVGCFFPDGMFKGLLDGLNTGIFIQQCHP